MPKVSDEYIETEFYKRFMRSAPERRKALIHALQAADACAREGLDKPEPEQMALDQPGAIPETGNKQGS